jgi:SAM-dependent methyltransferase
VYYAGKYWNDHPLVLRHINEDLTGDPEVLWTVDFERRFCANPFDSGLFLNCGNGWVEREFIDRGMVRRAIAFDYSADLLAQAEQNRGSRPIDYMHADANVVEFDDDQFDLVVNVGALHHVQYIERMAQVLCRCLRTNGILVAFDYIGPARNQYSRRHWKMVLNANRGLSRHLRKPALFRRPLAYMLWADATEAIHSDQVLTALGARFDLLERHDTGGGLAYEIITHNPRFFEPSPRDGTDEAVTRLLADDRRLTLAGALPPMFSYYLARPRKEALLSPVPAARCEAEARRELWAARHLGTYSVRDWLAVSVALPLLGAIAGPLGAFRRRVRGIGR